MTPLIWLILIIVLVMAAYGIRRMLGKSKPIPKCRHCGSLSMVEAARETKNSRTLEVTGGGAMAGGDVRLQFDQAVTYRCQSCGKTSIFDITKTN